MIQGDHSGSSQPTVDIKTKVVFQYKPFILKRNFCVHVNRQREVGNYLNGHPVYSPRKMVRVGRPEKVMATEGLKEGGREGAAVPTNACDVERSFHDGRKDGRGAKCLVSPAPHLNQDGTWQAKSAYPISCESFFPIDICTWVPETQTQASAVSGCPICL